ncbi:putative holin-like toxin [Companilactobacillus jidongensis]
MNNKSSLSERITISVHDTLQLLIQFGELIINLIGLAVAINGLDSKK